MTSISTVQRGIFAEQVWDTEFLEKKSSMELFSAEWFHYFY